VSRVVLSLVSLIAAAGLLFGCGEKTVKADGAAKSVTDLVSRKTGFTPTDVECPSGVEAKVDETLDCTFTGPEGPYTAHLVITKVDGNDVLFQIQTRRAG
jgi:uncharacterized protein DUF4333